MRWHNLTVLSKVAQNLTGYSGVIMALSIVGHFRDESLSKVFRLRNIRHIFSLKTDGFLSTRF